MFYKLEFYEINFGYLFFTTNVMVLKYQQWSYIILIILSKKYNYLWVKYRILKILEISIYSIKF